MVIHFAGKEGRLKTCDIFRSGIAIGLLWKMLDIIVMLKSERLNDEN